MKTEKIEILGELLKALDQKNFDLSAWKIKATLIVKKVFSEKDPKIALIEGLNYDYSSWALRDHSGGKIHDSVKDKAKEIIEAAILELKLDDDENPVMQIIRNEFTGSEYEKLQELISSSTEKENGLTAFIKELPGKKAEKILVKIILTLNE
ncbi:MAG: hypothetical protein K9H26_00965 [Prolixibacteraceae bacterium]|nr:hypothetical protein [Prolixibacteraceae bacterium]